MDLELSILQIILAILITIAGTIAQGAVGFGLGPLSVPLLVLVNPVFVPGPVLINALFLTMFMFKRERREVDYFGMKWAVVGRLIGAILAGVLLTILPEESLKLYFGVAIIVAVSISWIGITLPITRLSLVSTGTISGFMGTSVSIGGPPMALIYQNMSGPKIRSTLAGIFGIGSFLGVISLAAVGFIGTRELYASLILLPGIIVGFFLSKYAVRWLDKGFMKPAIFSLSTFAALAILLSYFI
jgi:uncharacterized membrane protein YfcA